MKKELRVFWVKDLVGILSQDVHGQLWFRYQAEWIRNADTAPLSISLPLREEPFTQRECRPFFSGLLPEDEIRRVTARVLGVSERNDFSLLDRLGGDCAGAISLFPEGQTPDSIAAEYEEVTEAELSALISKLPQNPLLAGTKEVRLSLAGAQHKIPLFHQDGKFSIPKGSAISSHILKPGNPNFPDLVENEYHCLQLAREIGLRVCDAEMVTIQSTPCLLVQRYDRQTFLRGDGTPMIQRVHQEDFCQALGIVPESKYQHEGGPSFVQCVELIKDHTTSPVTALKHFIDLFLFNFVIGNNDAHGKNFSLLHSRTNIENSEPLCEIAPAYDLVSTLYYPALSTRMAMKIGEYEIEKVEQRDFEKLANDAGLNATIFIKRLKKLTGVINKTADRTLPDSAFGKFLRHRISSVDQRFK
jgi:serine/threonine-protein kinase HipA